MLQLKFTETLELLQKHLESNAVTESAEPLFAISYDAEKQVWQVSDAMWKEKLNSESTVRANEYLLTLNTLIELLEKFRPTILLSKEHEDIKTQAIEQVKNIARQKLDVRFPKNIFQEHIVKQARNSDDPNWEIQLPYNLMARMAEYDPAKPNEINLLATAAMMDSIWMAQGLGTDVGLSHGGHVGALLASNTAAAGIAFSAASGIAMGIACGLLSAYIYEKHAVGKFRETHGKEPSATEKELIKADARIFGTAVFANISGWTLGLTVMQIAFSVASLHPVGIVINVVASVCAGVGQAVGAGLAFWRAEKEKFIRENNNEFDEKKWQVYRNKTGFVKQLVVTSLVAFVSGFAWNMVGTYLPAPIKKVLQHVKEPIKQTVNIVVTSIVSFFSTCTAMLFPVLCKKLFSKNSEIIVEKKGNVNEPSTKQKTQSLK